ncbi:MAG: hypothetical protein IJD95_02550 [Clostridia bacterium]|nr:hypothetical protein [Clostridia bacterium]
MKKLIILLTALFVSLIVFASCQGEGGSTPSQDPESSTPILGSQGDNQGSYMPDW